MIEYVDDHIKTVMLKLQSTTFLFSMAHFVALYTSDKLLLAGGGQKNESLQSIRKRHST